MALERDNRMADGTPPGTGPEHTPEAGNPANPENRSPRGSGLTPEQRNAIADQLGQMGNEGRRRFINDLFGRPTPSPTSPENEGPVIPPEGPRPPGVNLSQESIDAIKEPMERIAEKMGAARRARGDTEEEEQLQQQQQQQPRQSQSREAGRRSFKELHNLNQDWYNSFQEFSQYKKVMQENEDTVPEIQNIIWERVNGLLAVIDTDEAGDSPGIQEILQTVNILFAVPEHEHFRQDIVNWIEARLTTHQVAFAAKYLKAEDWAKGTTNLRGRHFESLLKGSQSAGVAEASAILEAADDHGAKGEWYRKPKDKDLDFLTPEVKDRISSEEKDSQLSRAWDLKHKYGLIDQMMDDPNMLGISRAKEVFGLNPPDRLDFITDGQFRKQDYDTAVQAEETRINEYLAANKDQLKTQYKGLFLYVLNGMEEETRPTVTKSAFQVVNEMVRTAETDPNSAIAKLLIGLDGNPVDTEALISMMENVNRAFVIGSKIHHSTAQSAIYDGIFWKKGAHVPKELQGSKEELGYENVGGGAIIIDPVFNWDLRDTETKQKTGKVIEIHLATDTEDITGDDDPRKEQKLAYQNALKINSGYIVQAWSKAYRDFYIENHDQIDWTNAIGGRGARTMKKLHYKIADEESVGEMSPGMFKHLRPYTGYTNTVSMFQFFGMNSNVDLLRGDKGWDKQFNRVKYNGARWAAMEKLQGLVEAKLLYDAHSVETPEAIVKTLGEIKNNAMILTKQIDGATDAQEQEVFEYMERMSEGVLDFRTHHSEEAELIDFNLNQADLLTRQLLSADVITRHQYDHWRQHEFGPEWLTNMRVFRGYISIKKGLFGFMEEFGKQTAKALSGK